METTRNRSRVLAQLLRAATHVLRSSARHSEKASALESIDAIAAELEEQAKERSTEDRR